MRRNKAIYEKYENKKEGSGRKIKYSKKYLLTRTMGKKILQALFLVNIDIIRESNILDLFRNS